MFVFHCHHPEPSPIAPGPRRDRAESRYVLSGAGVNYEKTLGDSPAAGLAADGHAAARDVASLIVDSASRCYAAAAAAAAARRRRRG